MDRLYPVVFNAAIVVKIRDGQVANWSIYTAIRAQEAISQLSGPP